MGQKETTVPWARRYELAEEFFLAYSDYTTTTIHTYRLEVNENNQVKEHNYRF